MLDLKKTRNLQEKINLLRHEIEEEYIKKMNNINNEIELDDTDVIDMKEVLDVSPMIRQKIKIVEDVYLF